MTPLAPMVSLAALAAGGVILHGTFAPTSGFWGKVIWRGPTSQKPEVALTFDDGPTPSCSDRILDVLAERRAPAAFFVIGQSATRWPDLLRRMDAEGHIVGNHTYDHAHLGMFGMPKYWVDQLSRTDETIAGIIGKRPAFFRPSMGFKTWPIHHAARRGGQAVITWSRRARDGTGAETGDVLRRLVAPSCAGDILMLHDGIDPNLRGVTSSDRAATIAALGPLIDALRQRGLSIVRLDELLKLPAYARF